MLPCALPYPPLWLTHLEGQHLEGCQIGHICPLASDNRRSLVSLRRTVMIRIRGVASSPSQVDLP